MKWLLTILLLISSAFGQYYYHSLDEGWLTNHTGTLDGQPDVLVLSSSYVVMSYHDVVAVQHQIVTASVNGSFALTKVDSAYGNNTNTGGVALRRIDDTHFLAVCGTSTSTADLKVFSIDGGGNLTLEDSSRVSFTGYTDSPKAAVAFNDSITVLVHNNWNDYNYAAVIETEVLTNYSSTLADAGNLLDNSVYGYDANIGKATDTLFVTGYNDKSGDTQIETFGVHATNFNITDNLAKYEVNANSEDIAFMVLNDTTGVMVDKWRTADETMNVWIIEWDLNGTNITNPSSDQSLNDHADGLPAISMLSNTEFVVWSGSFGGDSTNANSFSVDGSNNITNNNDRADFTGAITDQDVIDINRVAAFDDSTFVIVWSDFTYDHGYSTVRVSTSATPPTFGWSHQVLGVETPSAVNSATEFTKVSGVE